MFASGDLGVEVLMFSFCFVFVQHRLGWELVDEVQTFVCLICLQFVEVWSGG